MKNMKDNLFNKILEKAVCFLGESSIKISENSMEKCMGYVYEPKIPLEMLTKK